MSADDSKGRGLVFLDTNVLIYAYDAKDPQKYRKANQLIDMCLAAECAVISTQVVQELCNVAILKLRIPPKMIIETVDTFFSQIVAHVPDAAFYTRALILLERHSLSFYDALIVQAALDLGCTTLYSEDLQAGQTFGSLTIVNPFA